MLRHGAPGAQTNTASASIYVIYVNAADFPDASLRPSSDNNGIPTMPRSDTNETRTEVVGVFETADSLQQAIDALLKNGFDRAELSLLAGDRTVEEKLGHAYRKAEDLEDDPAAPREAYISTEARGDAEGGLIGGLVYVGAVAAAGGMVATGGSLAAVIGAAALAGGAGSLIGSVLAKLVGDHHAHYLQEQLDHGGMLLCVRTPSTDDEKRALDILSKYSAHDVHAHTLPAA